MSSSRYSESKDDTEERDEEGFHKAFWDVAVGKFADVPGFENRYTRYAHSRDGYHIEQFFLFPLTHKGKFYVMSVNEERDTFRVIEDTYEDRTDRERKIVWEGKSADKMAEVMSGLLAKTKKKAESKPKEEKKVVYEQLTLF